MSSVPKKCRAVSFVLMVVPAKSIELISCRHDVSGWKLGDKMNDAATFHPHVSDRLAMGDAPRERYGLSTKARDFVTIVTCRRVSRSRKFNID